MEIESVGRRRAGVIEPSWAPGRIIEEPIIPEFSGGGLTISIPAPIHVENHFPATPDRRVPVWARNVALVLFGLQLLAMVVFSTVEYHRYALTQDFANYSQAWWAIAHGHLDPYSAGFGVPFWRNNAEFAMWPLSLLYHVYPQPVVLLWVQDVAVVATEVVAFGWIVRVLDSRSDHVPRSVATALGVGAAVVLVADPWAFETIAFDFHFETLATLFVVLAGRDLWAGRTRRLWWWAPLALLSTALAGIYLVGVGLSGVVAGRRTRRPALVITVVGAAWVVALSALGGIGVGGTALRSSYGYLVGPHPGRVGLLDVALGAFGHPGSVAHMVAAHWLVVFGFLAVVGVVGVLSPWGLGVALVVLVPNILDGSGVFIRFAASFQSWAALPFVLVGTVMVLLRLLERGPVARRAAAAAAAVWAPVLAVFAFVVFSTVAPDWLSVSPAAASELARVQTTVPADAEIVVSQGVVGRFGERRSVYAFARPHQSLPVNRRRVIFVLTSEGVADALPQHGVQTVLQFVRTRLDARPLASSSGVHVLEWDPAPGTTHETLP